jgi:iron complex outermembrane receptor protein
VRANIFGKYANLYAPDSTVIQHYKGKVQTDLEVNWEVDDHYTLTVGGRNVFDKYPDRDKIGRFVNGQIYADGPIDWQGGFYFAKIAAKF